MKNVNTLAEIVVTTLPIAQAVLLQITEFLKLIVPVNQDILITIVNVKVKPQQEKKVIILEMVEIIIRTEMIQVIRAIKMKKEIKML